MEVKVIDWDMSKEVETHDTSDTPTINNGMEEEDICM